MSSLQALKALNEIFLFQIEKNNKELMEIAEREHHNLPDFGGGDFAQLKAIRCINQMIIECMETYSNVSITRFNRYQLNISQSEITEKSCNENLEKRIDSESQLIKREMLSKVNSTVSGVALLPESKALLEKLKEVFR